MPLIDTHVVPSKNNIVDDIRDDYDDDDYGAAINAASEHDDMDMNDYQQQQQQQDATTNQQHHHVNDHKKKRLQYMHSLLTHCKSRSQLNRTILRIQELLPIQSNNSNAQRTTTSFAQLSAQLGDSPQRAFMALVHVAHCNNRNSNASKQLLLVPADNDICITMV